MVFYQVAVKASLLDAALPLIGSFGGIFAFGVFNNVQRVFACVVQVV